MADQNKDNQSDQPAPLPHDVKENSEAELSPYEKRRKIWREEENRVRNAVGKQLSASIIAAFGIVVGLAWNTAITATINEFFPAAKGGLVLEFAYAIVLTLIVAVVGYYIAKFFVKEDDKKQG